MTWQTTWQSRWTTQTPSQCQSRASHQQNVGRTCTSCSTSTPSSRIPLASWRKTPQRTAFQVGISFQQSLSSFFFSFLHTPMHAFSFTSHFSFHTFYRTLFAHRLACCFSSLQTLLLHPTFSFDNLLTSFFILSLFASSYLCVVLTS